MPPDRRLDRLARLRERLGAVGLDRLLVTHLPNIQYLTGFTGTAGFLVLGPERAVLITDFRYEAQAERESGAAVTVTIERANTWDRLGRVLKESGPGPLGVEATVMTARDLRRVQGLVPDPVQPTDDLVEGLRVAKDAGEVDAIRRAVALAQDALAAVLPGVVPGQRELDVAAELERALRLRGSEWHPFPTIVASGPRSALPHARTSDRVIQPGEWLLLDFGAQVGGYCADLTRTVVVGRRADARQREVYEVVRQAQLRARTGIRAGQRGRDADLLARSVIAEAGFGEAFGHSLGHGLGLEVHEAPRLSPTADLPIPAGAVVTIEPGIYLPGWGGVRLEDDLHVTPGGPDLLSDGRTELVELV
jgi:Xaa-Pro aminopeptidase